jgi:hypothetical protein
MRPASPVAEASEGVALAQDPKPPPRPACCARVGAGIAADVSARAPLYASDWAEGFSWKALSAATFIFFSQAIPATAFAAFLSERTGGALGVAEALLSMGLGGLLFAVFAGQPLVIVGVTGPVCILVAVVSDVGAQWGLSLRGWMLCWCAWAAAFHALLALLSAPRAFAAAVTPFSGDVFGALIGLLYVVEGATILQAPFASGGGGGGGAAALALGLGGATAGAAFALSRARWWGPRLNLPAAAAGALADYGMPLAVVVATAAARAPAWAAAAAELPLLPVPSGGGGDGGAWRDGGAGAFSGAAALPPWAWAAGALPGAALTALLFFDHNISALMTQSPRLGLRKPPAFDWDFLLLGGSLLLTGALGLPPNYGLLPQAPLHAAALATVDPATGAVTRVCENRASPTLQAAALLALLAPPLMTHALGAVPLGVLGGVFLYLGGEGLAGNGAVARVLSVAAALRAGRAPRAAQAALAATQCACVGAIFGLTRTPAGLAFPVAILLLLPLRRALLPRLLGAAEVEAEDPHGAWAGGGAAARENVEPNASTDGT